MVVIIKVNFFVFGVFILVFLMFFEFSGDWELLFLECDEFVLVLLNMWELGVLLFIFVLNFFLFGKFVFKL